MTIDPENAVFADECVFREGMNAEQARVRSFIVNRGMDLERNVPRP